MPRNTVIIAIIIIIDAFSAVPFNMPVSFSTKQQTSCTFHIQNEFRILLLLTRTHLSKEIGKLTRNRPDFCFQYRIKIIICTHSKSTFTGYCYYYYIMIEFLGFQQRTHSSQLSARPQSRDSFYILHIIFIIIIMIMIFNGFDA